MNMKSNLTDNKASNWFKSLKNEEIELIEKNKAVLKYKKGEIVCKQGSFANHLIYIEEGTVKIYIEHQDKNLILKIAKAGEFIGIQSLFANSTFTYSAACIEDTVVSIVNMSLFNEIVKLNNNFATEIIGNLNQNINQYFDRFISLTQKQLHGRLADAILHLSKDVYQSMEFKLTLTRKDLAEFTGMSTESAIRILKEFHNDKIVNIDGKTLKITSQKLLEKLSEIG